MKPWLLTSLLTFLSLSLGLANQETSLSDATLVEEGASLTLAGEGFAFTEGPAVDKEGNVFFTDQPNNRIHRWDAATGRITLFLEPSGRANGLFIDEAGALWACADENNELWRIDLSTREHQVVVKNYEGRALNGPNDVWVSPHGIVYFSDPFYPRRYWSHKNAPQPSKHVYSYDPKTGTLRRVTEALANPNGIVGTADGTRLYISDIGRKLILRYPILNNGALGEEETFYQGEADGMTLDAEGRVYLAGKGITVVNANGKLVGRIEVPERWTGNLCFAGADRRTLFITASSRVYTLRIRTAGVDWSPASGGQQPQKTD